MVSLNLPAWLAEPKHREKVNKKEEGRYSLKGKGKAMASAFIKI